MQIQAIEYLEGAASNSPRLPRGRSATNEAGNDVMLGRATGFSTVLSLGTAAPRRAHFLHSLGKLVDVLEAAVDRREPYVSDLVQALELAHHQLAHLLALDFALRRRQQLVLDTPDRVVDRLA